MYNDSQLQQAVIAELHWEPSVTAAHIGVTANAGIVSLSGHVESFMQKQAAETAARRVKGVKAVAEEIEVRLPFHVKRGDDEIASAAINRLAWDGSLAPDAVKVKVEQGWVTLTGEVTWHFQQEAAGLDVRNLLGVVGVSNLTTIKPRVDTGAITDDITHALHRSWLFDPKTIKVSALGGNIKLSGTVQSWHDRNVAAATAWGAPGAITVENNTTVV
jgi:osmotically-inducible protein OsmY